MTDHVYFASSHTPANTIRSEPSIDHHSQTRSAEIPHSEMQRLQDRHSCSIFAKVLGMTVSPEQFSYHINSLLKPCGNLSVMPLTNGFFLVMFSDPSDYQNALHNGPWRINFCYILLRPWVPNFKPSEGSITKAKVWVRLYELPVEYYDPQVLLTIAEAIAPLVKFDPVTINMWKGRFARFCVELDFMNPLPDFVKLPNGFLQPVKYEGLRDLQCYGCRRVGHVQKDCLHSTSVAPAQAVPVVNPSVAACSHLSGHPAVASGSRFAVFSVQTDDNLDISGLNVPDQGYAVNAPEDSDPTQVQSRKGIASRVVTQARTQIQDANPAPSLQILQIPEQEAISIVTGTSTVDDNYFQKPVCSYSPVAHKIPQLMSPGAKFKHQVILRGVKEPAVLRDPVEIKETSNAGLPKVIAIPAEVSLFSLDVLINSSGNGNTYTTSLAPIGHPSISATLTPGECFVLSWNCRGAKDPAAIQALKDLIKKYNLSVVVLTETKISGLEAREVIAELDFSGSFIIEPVENSGGVWLLWDENQINIQVQENDENHFNARALVPVRTKSIEDSWYDVYGDDKWKW